jgi:inner membrane protein
VRPFWPFSERWISWDIVFIAEPVLLVVLTLGLIVPALFSLIDEEIGARDKNAMSKAMPRGRLTATVALVAVFAYCGLRDFEHRRAVAALQSRTYNGADAIRVSAYPYWVNPFRWHGVVETPVFFATMDVDSLAPEVDPEAQMQIRYKPEETPVTLAAKKTYLGRVYLSWAQYPVTETEQLENDLANGPAIVTANDSVKNDPTGNARAAYLVRFRDLRYDYPGTNARATLGATVFLTRDLQVVEERFGMSRASAENR